MDDAEVQAAAVSGRPRPPRSVLLATVAIAALVVVAVLVALALDDEPTTYAVGSPEAAFQAYYEAWETGDTDAAYSLLSSNVTSDVTAAEYRRMDSEQSWQHEDDRRIVLLGSTVTGGRAVLDLRIDRFSEGGLSGDRSSDERSVRLVRENGAWLVDEPLVGIESFGLGY